MISKHHVKAKALGLYDNALLLSKKLRSTQKKYVIGWGIALAVVVWYLLFWWGSSTTQQSTIVGKVRTGNIQDTIKIVWHAELTEEQKIRFNQLGKVSGVHVRVGDKVQRGDLIATLDQTTALNSIKQAQLDLQNANLKLQQIKEGDQEDAIQQAQDNLDALNRKFDVAKKEYDLLLQEEEKLNTDKQDDIDHLYDKDALLQKIMLEIKDSIAESRKSVENVDSIFGVTDAYKTYNPNRINISARDNTLKDATEAAVYKSYQAITDVENWYTHNTSGTGDIDAGLEVSEKAQVIVYDLLDTAYNALENSVVWVELPQSTLDQYQSQVSSDRSKAKSELNTIISFQEQLSTDTDISDIEYDYKKQLDNQKLQEASKQNDIASIMADIEAAKKSLQDAQDGDNKIEIEIQQNSIESAAINVENKTKELENLQITSPIDGTIRKIDFKVGDNLTNDEEMYVYIENPNLVQVSALVDQIDIVKMKVWQTVDVVFDSYTNQPLTGYLQEIDTSPDETAGVVSYAITVTLDKWDLKIYDGMTAKMKVIIAEKNNILVLPTQFIQEENGKAFVLIQNGKIGKKTPITIWLETSTEAEIVKWLQAWDTVMRYITATANKAAAPTVFGAGAPRGAGGWQQWGARFQQ